jgi:hypothetical protein
MSTREIEGCDSFSAIWVAIVAALCQKIESCTLFGANRWEKLTKNGA